MRARHAFVAGPGTIGTGRDADDSIVSFVLTPIAADAVFGDGFDG